MQGSRRRFIGIAGAGLASLSGVEWARAADTDVPPDVVVFNARVYTVDSKVPKAEAFLVTGGRFAAVGNSAEMRSVAGKGAVAFDARQMTIVPGFIDCHNHAPGNTLLYEVLVGNPYEVEFVTIASIVDKLRAKAASTPPGNWWKAISSTTPK